LVNSELILLLPSTYRAFYGTFQQQHPIQQRAIEPVLQQKILLFNPPPAPLDLSTSFSGAGGSQILAGALLNFLFC